MRCLLLGSFSMVLVWTASAHGADVSLTSSQQIVREQEQSTEEFIARFKDKRNQNLIGGSLWTAAHDYADAKHMREVFAPIENYLKAIAKLANGDGSMFAQLGGIKVFKERLSGLLNDEDESMRALAAVLLGVCGDKSYADELATLLKPRKHTREFPRYDRGRAALALGLVGARQYIPELVTLLKSRNNFDRSGAAFGLGALKAREYRRAVAVLLNDPDEGVRIAAKESLDMMREP